MPIADYRGLPESERNRISPGLRETIYDCQRRQEWYRDHRLFFRDGPLDFVGRASLTDDPQSVADAIASELGWTSEVRRGAGSWSGALAELRDRAEDLGVLVVISGMVGTNSNRRLDPDEFKGFALVDQFASLVFVNGADFESSKIFTLAHELAHLKLGAEGVSDIAVRSIRENEVERWCNRVAAELLVPGAEFESVFDPASEFESQTEPLARNFRVSTEVVLGRIRELGYMSWEQYAESLTKERQRVSEIVKERSSGGNYYNTKPVQMSKRFSRELIASTFEGHTSYTDAFKLLNVKSYQTFEKLGERLGVI